MSLQSKYIILDTDLQEPIVFSPLLQHRDIKVNSTPILSAGFCALGDTASGEKAWFVWGESVSLKKQSRPEDAMILNKYLAYDC